MRSNFLDFSMACFFFASFSQEADLLVDFVLEQIVGISDGRIWPMLWPQQVNYEFIISRFLRLQPFQWKIGRQPPKSMIRVAELTMIKKTHLPWIFRIQGDSVKQLDTIPNKVVDRVEGARLWSPFQLTSSWYRFPWQIHLLIDFAK